MHTPLFLEHLARPLMVLHALVAMALLGAVTHQAILDVGFVIGRYGKARLEQIYVRLVSWLYPITFLLGALIYPTYRVRIRGEVLDLTAPWASNAFDIKENLAALGLMIALTQVFARPPSPSDPVSRARVISHACLGLTLAAATWAQVVLGLIVSAEEGL